jgi:hypothetical protein
VRKYVVCAWGGGTQYDQHCRIWDIALACEDYFAHRRFYGMREAAIKTHHRRQQQKPTTASNKHQQQQRAIASKNPPPTNNRGKHASHAWSRLGRVTQVLVLALEQALA